MLVWGARDTGFGGDTDWRHVGGSTEAFGSDLPDMRVERLRQAVKPTMKYGHSRHSGGQAL